MFKLCFQYLDTNLHTIERIAKDVIFNGRYRMLLYTYESISDPFVRKHVAHQVINSTAATDLLLYINITGSHIRCFKFLLDFGLEPGSVNNLFIYSSQLNNKCFLETVLKYKPDININNGEALIRSCRLGDIDIVRLLLDCGITRDTNPNVLLLICVRSNVELFKLCIDSGVKVTPVVRNMIYQRKETHLYQLVGPKPISEPTGKCLIL
jgi:ankyrin repeat protein